MAPSTLPRGPSFFELRVWALLRPSGAWLLSVHRAKTATSGLMNKKVQRAAHAGSYGAHYPFNIAPEADVRAALGAGVYDGETRREIAAAVAAVHGALGASIPAGFLVFVGFDFIVDAAGRPWLIEANVKPAARYADLDAQFQSPVVRDLARAALADLVRLVVGGAPPGDAAHWTPLLQTGGGGGAS